MELPGDEGYIRSPLGWFLRVKSPLSGLPMGVTVDAALGVKIADVAVSGVIRAKLQYCKVAKI